MAGSSTLNVGNSTSSVPDLGPGDTGDEFHCKGRDVFLFESVEYIAVFKDGEETDVNGVFF